MSTHSRTGHAGAGRGRARGPRVSLLVMLGPLVAAQVLPAQTTRPLPPADEFLEEVRGNLARSDREQYRYAYMERRSEFHKNPFGRLGTDGKLLYEVTPGEELGVYFRQLVERDGAPIENTDPERVDRRNKSDEDRSVHDVLAVMSFELAGRERIGGRDLVLVNFTPKKDAKPRTRQGKMAKVFKGTAWVDEEAREVTRVEATAVDDLSYGWGIVARLHKGTRVSMTRERVDGSVWLPASIRLVGTGRAILFRKLDVDFAIEWFDYEQRLAETVVTDAAVTSSP